MFDPGAYMSMLSAKASHASHRHGVIAENIANADTPGYRARVVEPFADMYARHGNQGRVREMGAGITLSPNGNSVSLEDQMMLAAQTKVDHDMALGLYRKSLDMMKLAIGKNL